MGQKLESRAQDYVAARSTVEPPVPPPGQSYVFNEGPPPKNISSSVEGKMLILRQPSSSSDWMVNELHWELPQELRAKEPGEVGTVVYREFGRSAYNGSEYATYVTVVNLRTRQMIAFGVFPHVDSTTGDAKQEVEKRDQEVLAFLTSIPRS
ncbi:MAG: hypothetical protein H7Z38_01370 [Rubrivivax sp.]|nr:hypothetical protein [Pyrinomonadaceae bacterium]